MSNTDVILNSGQCACGQLVFDLATRRVGEILDCAWCGRKYRFVGGGSMQPVSGTEKFDAKPKAPAAPNTKDLKSALKLTPAPPKPKGTGRVTRTRAPAAPPGGVMPMVAFIVIFNALAFVGMAYVLPKGEDGLRHAFWDPELIVAQRAWWPDAAALVLGHVLGFMGWAVFVYQLLKRKPAPKP